MSDIRDTKEFGDFITKLKACGWRDVADAQWAGIVPLFTELAQLRSLCKEQHEALVTMRKFEQNYSYSAVNEAIAKYNEVVK